MTTLNFRGKAGDDWVQVDADRARVQRMRARLQKWSYALNNRIDQKGVAAIGVTLTYAPGVRWEANHIKTCMNEVRRYLGDRLLAYAWVAELQKRGAVHYHICLIVGPGDPLPMFDKAGWWVYGYTDIRKLKHVSSSYLTKYVQKGGEMGAFPPGLRLFACVIRCEVAVEDFFFFKLMALPGYARRKVLEMLGKLAPVVFALVPSRFPKNMPWPGWRWSPLPSGWLIEYGGGTRNYWEIAEPEFTFMGIEGDPGAGVDRSWMED